MFMNFNRQDQLYFSDLSQLGKTASLPRQPKTPARVQGTIDTSRDFSYYLTFLVMPDPI